MSVRALRRLVAALGPLVLVAAACGRPAVLDSERAEARIGDSLGERFDVDVTSVACPADIPVEEGATFTCTAAVAGGEVEVDVEQRDGDGALEVSPRQAVLVVERVIADMIEVLGDQFSRDDVEVTCPGEPVRIEEPGATFECTAVEGPQEVPIEVRVRDARRPHVRPAVDPRTVPVTPALASGPCPGRRGCARPGPRSSASARGAARRGGTPAAPGARPRRSRPRGRGRDR